MLNSNDQPAIPKTTTLTQTQGKSVSNPPVTPEPGNTPTTVSNEYSGSWYDPNHNGEGFAIEILANGLAQITWYTYDKAGQQAWIAGIGSIAGNTIAVTDAIITHGGVFGSAFNPDEVERDAWGTIIMTFNDCNHATVNYTGPAAFGSGTLNLERLTSISGLGCNQESAERPVTSLSKISGSWYDPSHNGEGYVIEVLDNNQAVVFWYTYDSSGNQTWVTGIGTVQDHRIILENTIFTEGGIFGPEFNPDSVNRKNWGRITFDFSSCNTGVATYESTSGFGSGQLYLERLTSVDGYVCEQLP